MSILKRIREMTTASAHHALDQLEKPEILLQQAVREMEHDLRKIESALAHHVARNRMIQQEQQQNDRLIRTTKEHIENHVRSGRDDRARNAIAQLLTVEQRGDELTKIRNETEKMVEAWNIQRQDMTEKLKEVYHKRTALIHRSRLAYVQKKYAQKFTEMTDGTTFYSLFDRMEQKVIALEAEAEIIRNARQMFRDDRDEQVQERIEEKLKQYKHSEGL